MALEDYDEYEQSEQVRKWIKENGVAVVVGVVIALGGVFGWRQWQAHQLSHRVQAAAQFAVVQNAVQTGNQQALDAGLADLRKHYAGTAYATLGSAAAAEYASGKDDLKVAAQDLEWAVAHSTRPELKSLFTLRYARVLLSEDKAQPALSAIEGIPVGEYTALAAELRGDALFQLGKPDAARQAYEAALASLDKDAPERNLVQMKLDNLAATAPAPAGSRTP